MSSINYNLNKLGETLLEEIHSGNFPKVKNILVSLKKQKENSKMSQVAAEKRQIELVEDFLPQFLFPKIFDR